MDCSLPWESMGFPRQEYRSGVSVFSPGDLSDPRIKPVSPALQCRAVLSCVRLFVIMWTAARVAGGFFTTEPQREPIFAVTSLKFLLPAQTFSEISLRYATTNSASLDHPHGKEMQKSKMAVWGSLTNGCEKKRSEKQRRKGKI